MERKGLLKQWLTGQSPKSYAAYKRCRNKVNLTILSAKRIYSEDKLAIFPELLTTDESEKPINYFEEFC